MTNSERRTDVSDEPTLEDHPGLDNDEATEAGKMMTASGSIGPETVDEDAHVGADDSGGSGTDGRSSRR